MARLRYNGLTAILGAPLASGDTTVTFGGPLTHSGGTAVPTLSGGDYIPLTILDPAGKVAEIVSLTAYTSGATTGSVTRAQESTTAKAHASGMRVAHGLTTSDVTLVDGGTAPASAQRIQVRRGTAAAWTTANPILAAGESGYETDTGKWKYGDGTTAWAALPYQPTPAAPGAVAYSTAATSIPTSAWTAVPLEFESFDSDGYHSTTVNNSKLIVPAGLGGVYVISGGPAYANGFAASRSAALWWNGSSSLIEAASSAVESFQIPLACVFRLSAGDSVEILTRQESGVSQPLAASGNTKLSMFRIGA